MRDRMSRSAIECVWGEITENSLTLSWVLLREARNAEHTGRNAERGTRNAEQGAALPASTPPKPPRSDP